MTGRDRYEQVGAATRQLAEAAAQADPPLRPLEWRILIAVIHVTASWSRLSDREYLDRLAEIAGVETTRTVGRELASLRDRGLITYEPARGRGHRGLVGLPAASTAEKVPGTEHPSDGEKAPGTGPLSGSEKVPGTGTVTASKGARPRAEKVPGTEHPPEKYPEEDLHEDADEPDTTDRIVQALADHIERRDGRRPRTTASTWKHEAVNLITVDRASLDDVLEVIGWLDSPSDEAVYWRDERPITSVRDLRKPEGRWERLVAQMRADRRRTTAEGVTRVGGGLFGS